MLLSGSDIKGIFVTFNIPKVSGINVGSCRDRKSDLRYRRLPVIGCTSLLAESGILQTRAGWGRQRVWTCRHAERRLKYYGYAFDSSLRLRHRRPAAMAAGPDGTLPTRARRGRHRVGTVC